MRKYVGRTFKYASCKKNVFYMDCEFEHVIVNKGESIIFNNCKFLDCKIIALRLVDFVECEFNGVTIVNSVHEMVNFHHCEFNDVKFDKV